MKIDAAKDRMGLWVICEAIGSDRDVFDVMKIDEEGMIDVQLIVGGVELDFLNVAKRINEIFDDAVTKKAQELLCDKYDSLINDLENIKERVEDQKERFKYDWE